jgi:ABC-2 type transport system permease protein
VNAPLRVNGLAAATRAEVLRLRRWPATWVLTAVWFALNLAFVYVFPYIAYRTGENSRVVDGPTAEQLAKILPAAVPGSVVQGTPLFGGAIVLVLGALAVGSGYGWGTWKTVFTRATSRTAALGGTLVALSLTIVPLVVGAVVADLAVSNVLARVEGASTDPPSVAALAEGAGSAVLVLGMWAAVGVLVGVLARSPALAVGLGLVWALVVENLLRGVASLIDGLAAVTDRLPGSAAGSLAGAIVDTTGPDTTPGVLSLLDQPTAVAVAVTYLVAGAGSAMVLMRRRDLT